VPVATVLAVRVHEARHAQLAPAPSHCIAPRLLTHAPAGVLDEGCSQEQCYDAAVRPLVEDCCRGYNVTAFAYGQTASGKTHTV
jgi:Kinesin motor domain